MKIEFVANASFLVTLKDGRKLLTDPWYSNGIYYGGWSNFPPLDDRLREYYLGSAPDYIYISHIHPDHLDRKTLPHFNKDTMILIGKYPTVELARSIRALGFHNIKELEFDKVVQLDGVEISILKQFQGTSAGYLSEVEYLMDSSLWIKDRDGRTLLNINDNPIKEADAERIAAELGHPDYAILPYGGASGYPHAFRQYSNAEKLERRDEVRFRMLDSFAKIATIINARWTIPAAGSYVVSGRIAAYSEFLHQATPEQIVARWSAEPKLVNNKLCLMNPGDGLEFEQGLVARSESDKFRNFSDESRLEYALSLKGVPIVQDEISIPDDFVIPFQLLLARARANLWSHQVRFNCFPKHDIEFVISQSSRIPTSYDGPTISYAFPLDSEKPYTDNSSVDGNNCTKFYIDSSLLLMILISAANWNNAEGGALIEIERYPDIQNATVHTLMNYFHV